MVLHIELVLKPSIHVCFPAHAQQVEWLCGRHQTTDADEIYTSQHVGVSRHVPENLPHPNHTHICCDSVHAPPDFYWLF